MSAPATFTTIEAMTNQSLHDQLREMWRTRPVRLPRRGPIAGVAAGIGYRYGVDPVLIRVAFVVATIFGGAGIVVYLAAWLLCSQAGDESSAAESLFGRGRSSESQTKSVVLLVALAIALSTVGPVGIGMGGSGLISMLLLLGGWWLLHQRQPVAPPPPAAAPSPVVGTGYPGTNFGFSQYGPYTRLPDSYVPGETHGATKTFRTVPTAAEDGAARATDPLSHEATSGTEPAPRLTASAPGTDPASGVHNGGTPSPGTTPNPTTSVDLGKGPQASLLDPLAQSSQPPAWDPLGVAPFAWDLPEPAPRVATAVAVPRKRSRITPHVLGVALLAAAAAGAAAASGVDWFTPARIGAIALAVLAAGLIVGAFLRRGYGLLILATPLTGFVVLASLIGSVEQHTFDARPADAAAIAPEYVVSWHGGRLDLRDVKLTQDTAVTLRVRAGGAEVIVPRGMRVEVDCRIDVGDCDATQLEPGTGPKLTIKAVGSFGGVEVRHE